MTSSSTPKWLLQSIIDIIDTPPLVHILWNNSKGVNARKFMEIWGFFGTTLACPREQSVLTLLDKVNCHFGTKEALWYWSGPGNHNHPSAVFLVWCTRYYTKFCKRICSLHRSHHVPQAGLCFVHLNILLHPYQQCMKSSGRIESSICLL